METIGLRDAYRTLLDTAATVAGGPGPVPPPGEWNADQILGHVSILTAATTAVVSAVLSAVNTTYDNRVALDTWSIGRTVELAGGGAGLRERIARQSDALCALVEPGVLSEAELDTSVPTRLLSHDAVLADEPMRLGELIAGLAQVELPGHTKQLLALLDG